MKNGIKDRILRILLNTPDGSFSKYQIAKLAECSEPWVGEFLKKLEFMGLISGTKVIKTRELYKYWLENKTSYESEIYFLQDPLLFFKEVKLDFMATTYFGEFLTGHHLFPSRYDIYVNEEEREKWKLLLNHYGLKGGGNLKINFVDKHFFYKEQKIFSKGLDMFIKVVSKAQLILDLFTEGGSCVEAAELLMGE